MLTGTTITFAVVGFFIGTALTGTITKMNLARANKLEETVSSLKLENTLLKDKLISWEKQRREQFNRRLRKLRSRKRKAETNDPKSSKFR
jgi:hypothetical protein